MIVTISDGCTYVKLTNNKITRTECEGVYIIDYDIDNQIVGIEYLEEATIKKDNNEVN